MFHIQRKAIAATLVNERVMRCDLHRLHVDGGNTSHGILHHHVKHSPAVNDTLFRHAAEINRSKYLAILRINHRRILRRMAEHVHAGGEGGWDYIFADAVGRRLYIPRGATQVVPATDATAEVPAAAARVMGRPAEPA